MATIKLIESGDSYVINLPKTLVDELNLQEGQEVACHAINGQLVIDPKMRPHAELKKQAHIDSDRYDRR